ncbi:MAG: caspase family protein [Chitinophagaceae bacterium]|nr:caspase family protein [Chitinophagaceae bacterium]
MKFIYFTFLFFLIFISKSEAQKPGDLWIEADKLFWKALKLWKDDKKAEAEKLFYKSWEVSPAANSMQELGTLKYSTGDLRGAMKVWNYAIDYLSVYKAKIYNSSPEVEISKILKYIIDANLKSGDPSIAIDTFLKWSENYDKMKLYERNALKSNLLNLIKAAFSLQDKDRLKKINTKAKTISADWISLLYLDVYTALVDNNYEEALKIALEFQKKGGYLGSKTFPRVLLAETYSLKGDYLKSEEYLDDAKKDILLGDNYFLLTLGINSISKKDYEKGIEYLTRDIKRKLTLTKILQYVKRAECYEGLKKFESARKDYEAALVYKPDYEPALNGLARLEGRVITERLTDKIQPQIIITEPLPARGIIIEAAGNEVMIKGIATDPGGLKSVTINGEKVYSQEGGTFWGNAVLKDGSNKVTIIATDFSGNNAEKTIEVERPVGTSTANAVPVKEGKNYALLIGCQNYDDNSIPSLEDPIPDAIKLKLILKNSYNFGDENVFTLFNPERSDFKKQFLEIYEVIQPEDNLVIFYAGHGIWVDKDKKGYWMLTDAKLNDVNTWLPNKEVLDMIARVPARHTLLITDACFSGSVFRTRGLNSDMPTAIQKINEKISRVAITSGNDTEVPDKSVFMKYLVKALSENKEKYMTAQKMFINQIIEAVMTETKTEPRYGTLELAGHVGGDYIFIRK